jgi:hypothetical protein
MLRLKIMDKKINPETKTENLAEPHSREANPVIRVSFWKSKNHILCLAAILILSFMVYLPSLKNGFVNWDDNCLASDHMGHKRVVN